MASVRSVLSALLVDVVLVVVFAVIGRASHAEDLLAGLWTTAWPFLAALAVGWLVAQAWRAPLAPLRTGLPVWAVTLVGGMLLRAASGQGTAVAFIVVAALSLLLLLVGWRALASLVTRRRAMLEA
ncbi:DUF3054 domain-containing protein [Microbacterium sp. W1N]|uniref:DUF3054 domain-containing protein n=1 Tax=Microbacterium festucae TaxID=2977531 RepID=UPI0021BEE4C0|nr:DUF3054 domain-containing protein [Microbacterium festucae]MCT9820916.1 DUF3054 domain-containing protein [Microbacterium festucae]